MTSTRLLEPPIQDDLPCFDDSVLRFSSPAEPSDLSFSANPQSTGAVVVTALAQNAAPTSSSLPEPSSPSPGAPPTANELYENTWNDADDFYPFDTERASDISFPCTLVSTPSLPPLLSKTSPPPHVMMSFAAPFSPGSPR